MPLWSGTGRQLRHLSVKVVFSCKYQMPNSPDRILLISCHKSWRYELTCHWDSRPSIFLLCLGIWLSSSSSQDGHFKFYQGLKSWKTTTKSLVTPETKLLKSHSHPGWCGSMDWVLVCELKGCWFDSQGTFPGCT